MANGSVSNVVWPKAAPPELTPLREVIPADIRDLLGPPPLTKLEDSEAYEAILVQTALSLAPTDFIEWTLAKDLTDLFWDVRRARRAKAVRLVLARQQGILDILDAQWPQDQKGRQDKFDYLAQRAHLTAVGVPQDLTAFNYTLESLGLTKEAVTDAAYLAALDDLERLDELIEKAMARRDAVLRELDRRRDRLAQRARAAAEAIDEAMDAEFK